MPPKKTYQNVYDIVQKIPRGKVATYGQIAKMSGVRNPRQIGYALKVYSDASFLPWHRVVNSQGKIGLPSSSDAQDIQFTLLQAEGIQFSSNRKISLLTYQWNPKN